MHCTEHFQNQSHRRTLSVVMKLRPATNSVVPVRGGVRRGRA